MHFSPCFTNRFSLLLTVLSCFYGHFLYFQDIFFNDSVFFLLIAKFLRICSYLLFSFCPDSQALFIKFTSDISMIKCKCHFQCCVFVCWHLLELVILCFRECLLSAVLLSTVPSGCWFSCSSLPVSSFFAGWWQRLPPHLMLSPRLLSILNTLQFYSASQLLCPLPTVHFLCFLNSLPTFIIIIWISRLEECWLTLSRTFP